jgi:hypothetical protein
LFLDRYNALKYPEQVLNHISDGVASYDQVAHLQMFFPQIYSDFKQSTLQNIAVLPNVPDNRRLLMYGYTGIETSPKVSKASVDKRLAAQMQPPQGQSNPPNGKTASGSKEPPEQTVAQQTFSPYSSPQGKAP